MAINPIAQRVARRFIAKEVPHIGVNLWDDDPPTAVIEVNFDPAREQEHAPPFPLDTYWRWHFIQWLKAQTEQAGFKVHESPPRELWFDWKPPSGASNNASVPAFLKGKLQSKVAHIESVLVVENPKWPGMHPVASWEQTAHNEFLEQLGDLYRSLGPWQGIPLHVSCES